MSWRGRGPPFQPLHYPSPYCAAARVRLFPHAGAVPPSREIRPSLSNSGAGLRRSRSF